MASTGTRERFAVTTRRVVFTSAANPLRSVSRRGGQFVAVAPAGDGTWTVTLPQTGLTATVPAASLHFTR